MSGRSLRKDLVDLVEGVPGWRLEPRTTPGASPLWCFVADGKIEFSVTVEGSELVLYDMETDRDGRGLSIGRRSRRGCGSIGPTPCRRRPRDRTARCGLAGSSSGIDLPP